MAKSDPISIKFEEKQMNKLLNERARLDRSINWIVRKAIELYFEMVERELNIIQSKKKK